MLSQAYDFYNENKELYAILDSLSDKEFKTKTLFKNWTFNDILRHLHIWNYASNLSLSNNKEWEKFSIQAKSLITSSNNLREFEAFFLNGIEGKKLLEIWKNFYTEVTHNFKNEDPKRRIKWVGPDMSVISSISARHMETWAHGQAIYDSLGIKRKSKDRIINIVIIGNNTFKWSYLVNKLKVPIEIPYLKLIAPSEIIWEFNDPKNSNKIEGSAEDFCKVVTQVRNIKDVNLELVGNISKEWMSIAQCFAGNAEKPSEAGIRKDL